MNRHIPYQVVFSEDWEEKGRVIRFFREDYTAFERAGIPVGITPLPGAERLIYRSSIIYTPDDYPSDPRYVHTYDINNFYLMMHRYLPVIADLSIPTFFVERLDDEVDREMKKRGWNAAFIKKDAKALEGVAPGFSIYPNHSLEEMEAEYKNMPWLKGKYCVRQLVDEQYIFENDARYWVLNGKVYRRDGLPIPPIVTEAAQRLIKAGGGLYFTIDATPDFIIEVNPGESSDRHGENSAELFASWWYDAFVRRG